MYKYNFKFTGSFWEFFFMNLALGLVSIGTFGVIAPYWIFWNIQFLINNVEVLKRKV
ncbi:hypothetical protein [uncultured Mediterranean phage uvMED]|nr:hypothetical protein [uncultured Mediterranean phage uvMED]BAR22599.1 hypothetical protein [uncultured Mediterranean phage uvMED]